MNPQSFRLPAPRGPQPGHDQQQPRSRSQFFLIGFIAFTALVLLADATLAQAWAGRGRLNGKVMDSSGNPIEGAKVTLALSGAGPDTFTTNKKGRWAKAGLAGGMWDVKVEMDGFGTRDTKGRVGEYDSAEDRTYIETTLSQGGGGDTAAAGDDAADAEVPEGLLKIQEANGLLQQEKWPEARGAFTQALETLDPEKKPAVQLAIAQTWLAEENTDQAVNAINQVLEGDASNVDALNLMARTLISADRADEAQAYLDRLPAGAGVDADVALRQGVEAYNANDLPAAIKHFSGAIDSRPDLADAYYYRGLAAMAQQDNATAIGDFKKLLELAPESPKAAEGKQFLEYLESQ